MGNHTFDRRNFLKTSLLATAGTFFAGQMVGSEKIKPASLGTKTGKIVRRKLGNTGIELPVVSYGVMEAKNPNVVRAAYEKGMEHFDTAHVYQRGNNEKMLGKVLKDYPRDSFTIATKVPPEEKDKETGHLLSGSTKEAFLEKLNTSLERLKMDYVDILYIHSVSSRQAALFEPMLDALQTAKRQGKARHVGLSTHSHEPEVLQAAIDSGVHEVVLTAYNFTQEHREELGKMIAKASNAGIGIVGMKSMAGGQLGKKVDKKPNYQAALKWVLENPHVHTTIPGILTFEHLEENFSVMDHLKLTPEERNYLTAAAMQEGLYCDGCETCKSTCRKDIPIPEMMRAYMYAYGYRQMKKAKDLVTGFNMLDNPCKDCAICTVACKKGFDVRSKLADISRISKMPDDFLV